MKIKKLNEALLTEDKIVKFDGEVSPKFGWCVIMCGGPGSGKSTALDRLVPIQGKHFDVDMVKGLAKRHGEIVDNEFIFNGKHYSLDGISEPYDLTNPEYVTFLHMTLKPLTNKIRQSIYNMGEFTDKERLPNVIFDVTGSETGDFDAIITALKPLGYKFAIVFVYNEIKKSLHNNNQRTRKVSDAIVLQKYGDVITTVSHVLADKGIVDNIDEMWLVDNSIEINPYVNAYGYVKEPNVMPLLYKSGNFKVENFKADLKAKMEAEIAEAERLARDNNNKVNTNSWEVANWYDEEEE